MSTVVDRYVKFAGIVILRFNGGLLDQCFGDMLDVHLIQRSKCEGVQLLKQSLHLKQRYIMFVFEIIDW